jgi:hypothetical protein
MTASDLHRLLHMIQSSNANILHGVFPFPAIIHLIKPGTISSDPRILGAQPQPWARWSIQV